MNIFCTYFELIFDRVRNILIVGFCLTGTGRILNRLPQNIPDFDSIVAVFEKIFCINFQQNSSRLWAECGHILDRFWTGFEQILYIIWTNFVHISNILRKKRWTKSGQFFCADIRQTLNICWSIIEHIFTYLPNTVRYFTDPILTLHSFWTDFDQNLDRFWVWFKHHLNSFQTNFKHLLLGFCTDFDQSLCRFYTDFSRYSTSIGRNSDNFSIKFSQIKKFLGVTAQILAKFLTDRTNSAKFG